MFDELSENTFDELSENTLLDILYLIEKIEISDKIFIKVEKNKLAHELLKRKNVLSLFKESYKTLKTIEMRDASVCFNAVFTGNLSLLMVYLESGSKDDVNKLFYYSVYNNDISIVTYLQKNYAIDYNNNEILKIAIKCRYWKMVQFLIKYFPINSNLISNLVEFNQIFIINELMDVIQGNTLSNLYKDILDKCEKINIWAIIAVKKNHILILKKILDPSNNFILQIDIDDLFKFAILHNRHEIISYLGNIFPSKIRLNHIEMALTLNYKYIFGLLNALYLQNSTVTIMTQNYSNLEQAMYWNQLDLVKKFINDSNLNTKEFITNLTFAINLGNVDIIEMFIELDVDNIYQNLEHYLLESIKSNRIESAEYLGQFARNHRYNVKIDNLIIFADSCYYSDFGSILRTI